ncbi:MAG: cytochrome c [Spirochaetota bacterium]|nr:cytochrome c [Spirochaetota bacterium]
MKKYGFVAFLFIGVVFLVSLAIKPAWAADGKSIYTDNGCSSCHNQDKGKAYFPSKEQMAKLTYSDFKVAVQKGRSGTAMRAYDLSDSDCKAMYDWLQEFK